MSGEIQIPGNAAESEVPKEGGFSFATWYEKNKGALSERRKARYRNDPEYREKSIQAARDRRANLKRDQKPVVKDFLTIQQMCDKLGMSIHTYRKYQLAGWIPVTHIRGYTEAHLSALGALYIRAQETRNMRRGRMEVLQPYVDALRVVWDHLEPSNQTPKE